MAQFDPWTQPTARGNTDLAAQYGAQTDAAAFMAKVYRWMALGLGLTGFIAMYVASSPELMRAIFPMFLPLIIAEFVVVLAFGWMARRSSFAVTAGMFLLYAALNGVTFSVIFLAYTHESIASTFFVTAGAFGGMSAYGTLTKKDLTSWGSFLFMGLIGVVIAGIVNLFVHSGAMSFVISCCSVIVFTGLTAYDTQKLRGLAAAHDDRLSLLGALTLYLDFVNLFLALLRLFGSRRD